MLLKMACVLNKQNDWILAKKFEDILGNIKIKLMSQKVIPAGFCTAHLAIT